MPNGLEHVEAALERIESASAKMGELEGVEASWRSAARERLAAVADMLQGMKDRFFLKTRVCLPFARKCDKAAAALGALLDRTDDPAARESLEAALVALEKTARVLDERSMMQGMAIT